MFEYLFLSVDGRRTHWYGNSSLWPFGPGELKHQDAVIMGRLTDRPDMTIDVY